MYFLIYIILFKHFLVALTVCMNINDINIFLVALTGKEILPQHDALCNTSKSIISIQPNLIDPQQTMN